MKGTGLLLLAPLLGAPAAPAAEPEILMTRVADEDSGQVSVVQATRGAGAAATRVVVLQGPRGNKLFLRRSQPEGAVTLHEAWLGAPPALTFTRRGTEPVLFEAGGRSLRFLDADLGRPTVRCWIGAFASRVDPKFLEVAAAVKLLKEWAGGPALGDVFYPMTVLWQAGDPLAAKPKGALKVQKGPFAGEPWDRLAADALPELGRQ